MKIKTATISKNRQIAIPSSFGFKSGEKVKILIDEKTQIITIQKLPDPVETLFGIAKQLKYSSDEFIKEKKVEILKRNKKLK
jgi:bifunctional DNA-binding transcriptional regulator/antitoxin component of YhaV-PrlF toxin-antitoxin module